MIRIENLLHPTLTSEPEIFSKQDGLKEVKEALSSHGTMSWLKQEAKIPIVRNVLAKGRRRIFRRRQTRCNECSDNISRCSHRSTRIALKKT